MGTRDPGPNALPPQSPRALGPCNTSAGRSEGLHHRPWCLWISKSMWAFHKCDLKPLAESRAVLIPAALQSPGGRFPVLGSPRPRSTCTRIAEVDVLSTNAIRIEGSTYTAKAWTSCSNSHPAAMLCCPQPCVRLEQSPRAVRHIMSGNRPLCCVCPMAAGNMDCHCQTPRPQT